MGLLSTSGAVASVGSAVGGPETPQRAEALAMDPKRCTSKALQINKCGLARACLKDVYFKSVTK